MGRQVVEATVRGDASGLANTIRVREWTLVGDEPEAIGGTDTGPSPFEYLLSALGCCTSMTLALYAKRKGWPLEAVEVHLRHERVVGESPLDRIGRVKDCIAYGPGILDLAHQPDEYVVIEDMVDSAKIMALALHHLLHGRA